MIKNTNEQSNTRLMFTGKKFKKRERHTHTSECGVSIRLERETTYLVYRLYLLPFSLSTITSDTIGCSWCRIMSCCRIIWITVLSNFVTNRASQTPQLCCESPEQYTWNEYVRRTHCDVITGIIYWASVWSKDRHQAVAWLFNALVICVLLAILIPMYCTHIYSQIHLHILMAWLFCALF